MIRSRTFRDDADSTACEAAHKGSITQGEVLACAGAWATLLFCAALLSAAQSLFPGALQGRDRTFAIEAQCGA